MLQQYTREIRKAKDVLCPSLVDKVSSNGYCDVLYVSELGSGIHRGAMGFGRLYQVSSFSPVLVTLNSLQSNIVTFLGEVCPAGENRHCRRYWRGW